MSNPVRPFYWSVRRELWENRSIYVAPLFVASLVMFGFFVSTFTLARRTRALVALAPLQQQHAVTTPYNMVAGMLAMTALFVGAFYCLDALHGERRDRSILFWKSLPVSDRTTVLSKASIPMVVLPAIAVILAIVARLLMLILSTLALLGHGQALALHWRYAQLSHSTLAFLYGVAAFTLWHAPIYAWLLLVSAWAKRAAVLWALLPFVSVAVLERIIFNTQYLSKWLMYRVGGVYGLAFDIRVAGTAAVDPLARVTAGRFLSTPGLWLGLAVAAALLYAAVKLRRDRDPI
jgi:ABC-2 type transport system permease protein